MRRSASLSLSSFSGQQVAALPAAAHRRRTGPAAAPRDPRRRRRRRARQRLRGQEGGVRVLVLHLREQGRAP